MCQLKAHWSYSGSYWRHIGSILAQWGMSGITRYSTGRALHFLTNFPIKLSSTPVLMILLLFIMFCSFTSQLMGFNSGPMTKGRFTQSSNGRFLPVLPNFPIKLSSTPVHTILFFFIMIFSITSQSMSIACSGIVIDTFKLSQYCGPGHLVTAHDDGYCSGNVRLKGRHVT